MMQTAFPPKSKFSVDQIPDLTGKVIIVTGANTGIGKETAKALLSHGATVYIAARSADKSAAAIRDLKALTGREACFLQVDLANLKAIKRAVEEFMSKETQLHILFNNGGVMNPPIEQTTVDGYDLQVGTNALGHFYFTKLLLPILIATAKQTGVPSRVMTTSSVAITSTNSFDFDTFKDGPPRRKKGNNYMYGQSKLANLVFAIELHRRYESQGIISAGVNPGLVKSDLQRTMSKTMHAIFDKLSYDTPQGALTQLWGGTLANGDEIKGKYLVPWARVGRMHPTAEQPILGRKLWDWFEQQVVNV